MKMTTKVSIVTIVCYLVSAILLSYFKASANWHFGVGLFMGQFFGIGYGMARTYEKYDL